SLADIHRTLAYLFCLLEHRPARLRRSVVCSRGHGLCAPGRADAAMRRRPPSSGCAASGAPRRERGRYFPPPLAAVGWEPGPRSVHPTARCHRFARMLRHCAGVSGANSQAHATVQDPPHAVRSVSSVGQEALMAAAPPRHFLHQNRLLRALAPATVQQVLLTLQPLALRNKDTLIARDELITAVYFPLDAVVSIVSTLADGTTLEVATIGNEG